MLVEINRLQESKANWGATLLILLVSGVLFYLIGSAAWNWKTVALLIPILLFHELGHYLAMRAFGYRNLRMFFIPLFGAAVTGRNYNVAAWKKAVVSLMGPVPGIGVGIALGIAAYVMGQKVLLEAAALMVFINGINLLPILPLDGGWNLHAIVFSRHYVLDVGFRLVAALLLVSGGAALHEYFLLYLGAAMLLGLPMEYRRSQVVSRLRRERFAARSLDSQTVPEETARRIISEIDASYPKRMSDRATARLTLQIFESLNARPPGIFAIVMLAAVHFAAFVVALFFSIVFFVALHAKANQPVLRDFVQKPVTALPMHSVAANTLRTLARHKGQCFPAEDEDPDRHIRRQETGGSRVSSIHRKTPGRGVGRTLRPIAARHAASRSKARAKMAGRIGIAVPGRAHRQGQGEHHVDVHRHRPQRRGGDPSRTRNQSLLIPLTGRVPDSAVVAPSA